MPLPRALTHRSDAAQAGLDHFAIKPGGLNGSDDWLHGLAASLDVPASFQIGPELALLIVPGVTVFPDRLEGYEFHGMNSASGRARRGSRPRDFRPMAA